MPRPGKRIHAIDAAVAAVENVAAPGFDGTQVELEALLLDGLNSGPSVDVDEGYWNRLRADTDAIGRKHLGRNPPQ